jgi:hypothetical protein
LEDLKQVAEKHPYASPGAITAAVNQFKKSFPPKITADTLRKLRIAPNNESYVINTLRFVGAIDSEGNKTEASTAAFNQHNPTAFQNAFGEMVKNAYVELFNLVGDNAWELDFDSLIHFFRQNDQTSDIVGRRQATTFQALASLAGHGAEPVQPKPSTKSREPKPKRTKAPAEIVDIQAAADDWPARTDGVRQRDVGLTVRIEVNLPPAADQETYDRIFRSIRENLLNAK